MTEANGPKRKIVFHAPSEALSPHTDVILGRLGYQILSPAAYAEQRGGDAEAADLLLVDERRLSDVEADHEDGARSTPIVLLTGQHGTTGADPRIVGAVKRPAGLHDLYRLMQQIFEDKPRATPRIATQLRARCSRQGQHWDGRVLSLSQNGCLIRTPEAIPLGQHVELQLDLPLTGSIAVDAEAAYQLLPDVGLVFSALAPAHRTQLERFVTQAILNQS